MYYLFFDTVHVVLLRTLIRCSRGDVVVMKAYIVLPEITYTTKKAKQLHPLKQLIRENIRDYSICDCFTDSYVYNTQSE
jgi:hypothetical protein